jgi:hypothetical protein
MHMQLGITPKVCAWMAGTFLIFTGVGEWGSQSKGANSWYEETSFAALALRAQGKLKIGLGIGFLALAAAGFSEIISTANKKSDPLMPNSAPEPPNSKPSSQSSGKKFKYGDTTTKK